MENKTQTRKKPICKSCRTPMKGHKQGVCRPNPWCDHGDNNKLHGGHYEWETERWTGSKWVPLVVTAVAENQVVVDTGDSIKTVPISQIMQAPPRDAFLESKDDTANESEPEESDSESALVAALAALVAPEPEMTPAPEAETTPEAVAEAEPEKEEWKPLADRYWWNYYTNWQQNSTFVKFPTLVGMTSAQLGDIMENYAKYRNYYYYN